ERELAIGRDRELVDAVGVDAEARDLLLLDVHPEETHRRVVLVVLDDIAGVLLFLQPRLALGRVFLGSKDDGIVAGPGERIDAALAVGQHPGLAAGRIQEPDLSDGAILVTGSILARGLGFLVLALVVGPVAEEGEVLAVGRPAWLGDTVLAGRQRDLPVSLQSG